MKIMRAVCGKALALCLCLVFAGFLCACKDQSMVGDDLSAARTAVSLRNWSLAERFVSVICVRRVMLTSCWEAWQQLLVVLNAAGQEPRATLECLETMLARMDNDARSAVILRRMGEVNEGMRCWVCCRCLERLYRAWRFVDRADGRRLPQACGHAV